MDEAGVVVAKLRRTFDSGKCRPLGYRKNQLRSLLRCLEEEEDALLAALKADLAKCRVESIMLEVEVVRNAARTLLYDLDGWAKDEPKARTIVTLLDTTYVRSDPLGVVLVISPWNYPAQLALSPVAGAIAAGNCVVLKPSELAPRTSAFFKNVVTKYLDPDSFSVVEGDADACTELLKQRFDHIFFTGGTAVGKIVARAAAEHLTPCTLELGGKSPVYIDDTADMAVAAKRLVWGKCINLGQTCVAPDYVLCSETVEKKLVAGLKKVFEEFYGPDPGRSPDLGRIVSGRHFERLRKLIEATKARQVMGGVVDPDSRFIDLHVYADVGGDDPLMGEEIFGPILPVVRAESVEEAAAFIRSREKPLTMYVFSGDARVQDALASTTSSGSLCVNDCVVQLSVESLPFGGVGMSGHGSYHGRDSFDTFSHRKSVLVRDLGFLGEWLGSFRYPPYGEANVRRGQLLLTRRHFPQIPFRAAFNLALVGLGAGLAIGAGCIFGNGV